MRTSIFVAMGLWATVAQAQIPLPFFGEEDKPKPAPSAPVEPPPDRNYQKPTPRPLPEGEADILSGSVVILELKGIVNPGMGEFTIESLARAEAEGAQLVIMELNTPGGLVSTTQKMVQAMLGAKVPVVVYVTPSGAHAASAGTFITLSGHVAAMAPASRIGAAHPVTGGGKDPEAEGGKHMAAKVENDLVALVEGIARERIRNVEWAMDAVRFSISVTAEKAVEIGVVDLMPRDRAELIEQLEGRQLLLQGKKVELRPKGAQQIIYAPSLRNRFLGLLADPGIAMLLGLIGVIGIMIEVYHPGLIVPGVAGALALICSLIAVEQLPIDIGAGLLVLVGLGLLVAELYASTHGALAVLGTVGISVGLVLLVDPGHPDFAVDPGIRLSWWDVLPGVALLGGLVGYLSFFVLRQRRIKPSTGQEGLLGSVAQTLEPVGPTSGTVFVAGEYWQARATENIAVNQPVEITRVNGLVLEVRRRES